MTNVSQVYVGVDVSKKHLDVCLNPINKAFRVTNDEQGMRKMLYKLSCYNVQQVVCEASGGYERKLVQALSQKHIKVWRVEPKRIKSYIASEGIKVKTDAVDARMIAKFAAEKQCNYASHAITFEEEMLQNYVVCRSQIVQTIAAEKTKLEMIADAWCRDIVRSNIQFLENQVKQIEKKINSVIEQTQRLKERIMLAESMPGIGRITAAALISLMPELGSLGSKQIAALAGVAPYQNQSGKFARSAIIKAGRPAPRRALYMAALTASSSNKTMKEFYQRLKAAGKKSKVALVAVMRKMIVSLNAMLRDHVEWKNA